MNSAHTGSHYSRWSIGLHWLMLALIALAYAFIELRVFFERGTPERAWLRDAHTSVGLLVLGLVVVRIVARLVGTTPPITPTPPAWQRAAARLSHGLLYAFMIGMPLLGWVMVSMRGGEASFFGLGVPLISAENKELGKVLRGWHGDIGRAVYFLIALHAAAAIYHHKRLRDDTLLRMLPALRRTPRPAPSSRPPAGP